MILLSKIPAPPSGAIESWLLSAAAIASMAVLARKLFVRKGPPQPELVTKSEFHHEIIALRDKIDARFLSLAEKMEEIKGELLAAGERRDSSTHARLDEVEAG